MDEACKLWRTSRKRGRGPLGSSSSLVVVMCCVLSTRRITSARRITIVWSSSGAVGIELKDCVEHFQAVRARTGTPSQSPYPCLEMKSGPKVERSLGMKSSLQMPGGACRWRWKGGWVRWPRLNLHAADFSWIRDLILDVGMLVGRCRHIWRLDGRGPMV